MFGWFTSSAKKANCMHQTVKRLKLAVITAETCFLGSQRAEKTDLWVQNNSFFEYNVLYFFANTKAKRPREKNPWFHFKTMYCVYRHTLFEAK